MFHKGSYLPMGMTQYHDDTPAVAYIVIDFYKCNMIGVGV